jgi:hypothetical protein
VRRIALGMTMVFVLCVAAFAWLRSG